MDSVTGRPVLTVWFDSHKNRFVYRGRQFKQLHLAVDSAVVEARYGNKSDLNGREFTVADNAAELFAQYLTATYINKDGES
jgi:hypothetical protein